MKKKPSLRSKSPLKPIILIAFVVVIIIYFGYLLWNFKSQAKNYQNSHNSSELTKIFTDPETKISFKYPEGWNITESVAGQNIRLVSLSDNKAIEVVIDDNPDNLSPTEFIEKRLKSIFNGQLPSTVSIETFNTPNFDGYKVIGIPEGLSNLRTIVVTAYQRRIIRMTLLETGEIGGVKESSVTQDIENTFFNIINTVKISTDETRLWKTYSYLLKLNDSQLPKDIRRLTISYPPSLIPEIFGDNIDHTLITVTFKTVNPTKPYGSGDFQVAVTMIDPKSLSLKEYVDNLTLPGPSTGISVRNSIDSITVASLQGLRVEATGVGGNNLGLFLNYDQRIISITASYSGNPNQEYIDLFDQMVNNMTLN